MGHLKFFYEYLTIADIVNVFGSLGNRFRVQKAVIEVFLKSLSPPVIENWLMQNQVELDDRNPGAKTVDTTDFLGIFNLSGKVAVVTGGTGVLGSALAIGLARAGAKVGILGRRSDAAEATGAAIRRFRGEALALTADVLDVSTLEAAPRKKSVCYQTVYFRLRCQLPLTGIFTSMIKSSLPGRYSLMR
jgi:hypothetical protein